LASFDRLCLCFDRAGRYGLGLNQFQGDHMALRVARGLFRLWLVLSVLWIGGVVFVRHGILLALVPPAFVLALGSALVWASKGFRE
jgi:hypothetical protein